MTIGMGALAVRRSIVIEASPERIWEEFTNAERMQRWFLCQRLVLEPYVGGRFETEGTSEPILRSSRCQNLRSSMTEIPQVSEGWAASPAWRKQSSSSHQMTAVSSPGSNCSSMGARRKSK